MCVCVCMYVCVCATLCSNGFLEPHELASFLRGLIKGLSAREQHYLLTHLAGMDVTGEGHADTHAHIHTSATHMRTFSNSVLTCVRVCVCVCIRVYLCVCLQALAPSLSRSCASRCVLWHPALPRV